MRYLWLMLVALGCAVAATAAQTIHLKDYLGHTWSNELVGFPLDAALAKEPVLSVTDAKGAPMQYQVYQNKIYLLVTLPADGELTYTVTAGPAAADKDILPADNRQVQVADANGLLTFDSGVMALRMPAGEKTYPALAEANSVPGPILGVRQGQGPWVGKSWLDAPLKVLGYATSVTAQGPLFAEATTDYTFEGGKHYRFTARVIAGQATAIIDETMNLNPSNKYAMLHYDNDADASTWEWWSLSNSEHLGVADPHYPLANLVFSLKDGLQPNQSRWTGGRVSQPKYGLDANGQPLMDVESAEAFAPLTYADDERVCRIAGWWLNSFSNYAHSYTAFNDADPNLPAVSVSTGRASRNVNPNLNPTPESWIKQVTGFNDLAIWTKPATKDLQIIGPICLGSREWLLTVESQQNLPKKGSGAWTTSMQAHLKYGRYPLDKIKDWSFDWPEPANAWPRLFCKAGDLAGMQARVQSAPLNQQTDASVPAIYRKGGTSAQMAQQALAALKPYVDGPLNAGGHGGVNWFHANLHMISTMPIWEAALATPDMDPKVRAKIKAYGAFIAQHCWDDDFWPPKETNNGWGSVNMGTLGGTARVLTAAAMAGVPGGEARLKRCRGYLDGNIQPLLAEDGSAVSCPHYIEASMQPILYMALALKYGGDYDAFAKDPRLARFGQFETDILTPPDPRSPKKGPFFGLPMGSKYDLDPAVNRRNLWPLGNTSRTEPTAILTMLALGYQGVDDHLAGVLNGVSADMGNAGGGFIAPALVSNAAVPPAEPTFQTRLYPNYCAILRDRQPMESWFAIRYSRFAFDHFESETGAFSWFAKGVPMMMGFGNMYSPDAGQGVFRSRPAWDVQEGTPKPCPGYGTDGCFYKGYSYFEHKVEPWTDKVEAAAPGAGILDHYGSVKTFSSTPGADFLMGQVDVKAFMIEPYYSDTPVALKADPNQKRDIRVTNPFAWQRRVLFNKAQAPNETSYLLIRDDFTAPCPPTMVSYWITADDLNWKDNQAFAKGQFGVNLDLYFAQPVNPVFSRWEWQHKNWGGEKQLCLRVNETEGKPVLAVLYPRTLDEPVPVFTTLAGGNGVKITQPVEAGGATEYAFIALTPVKFTEGKVSFVGTSGRVRVNKEQTVLALSESGEASAGDVTLATTGAATLAVTGKTMVLQTSGPKQTIVLSGDRFARGVKIDGKRVSPKKGVISLTISAGEQTLNIQ